MGLFRQTAKQFLTWFVPRELLLTRGARCRPPKAHRIALTFDDGPHPTYTPILLDQLKDAGLRATFFVVGKHAEAFPGLIERIHDEGHEIGNHTWSHSPPAETSPDEFIDEVRRTDEFICGLTGVTPQSMRPPKGELTLRKLLGLWKLRKTVALWSVDPRDYLMSDANQIDSWCANYRPQDGDVLLFHDNHPHAIDAVKRLQCRGDFGRFQAVTVSELAAPNIRDQRLVTNVS